MTQTFCFRLLKRQTAGTQSKQEGDPDTGDLRQQLRLDRVCPSVGLGFEVEGSGVSGPIWPRNPDAFDQYYNEVVMTNAPVSGP